eukprot:m.44082 g.44082  ORF g.44082 m.44082 type:complete len:52 (-) comp10816_c1_seq1:3080-3235(-)
MSIRLEQTTQQRPTHSTRNTSQQKKVELNDTSYRIECSRVENKAATGLGPG